VDLTVLRRLDDLDGIGPTVASFWPAVDVQQVCCRAHASLTACVRSCIPDCSHHAVLAVRFAELLMPRYTDSVTQVSAHTVKVLVLVVPMCALAAFTTTD
jgi:hypothetical protein